MAIAPSSLSGVSENNPKTMEAGSSISSAQSKTAQLFSKIADPNFSFKGMGIDLFLIAGQVGSLDLSLQKIIELANEIILQYGEESILIQEELLSKLPESFKFQIAKKIVGSKDLNLIKHCLSLGYEERDFIKILKLSKDHRFFLAREIAQLNLSFMSSQIKKFNLSPKKIMDIARIALKSDDLVERTDLAEGQRRKTLLSDRISFYLSAKAALSKKFSKSEVIALADKIKECKFHEHFYSPGLFILGMPSEVTLRIVDEFLKTKDGIIFLAENISDFSLSLERREQIAYFLLNNNFKDTLLQNLSHFQFSEQTRLKIINILMKNKKTRKEIFSKLPSSFWMTAAEKLKIYKKYMSIELFDLHTLSDFQQLQVEVEGTDFSKNAFFLKYSKNRTQDFELFSFYFSYFATTLGLTEQNQEKLLGIFDQLMSQSFEKIRIVLFRSLVLFLSKAALSKPKDLSFLDNESFLIDMIFSVADVRKDTKEQFFKNLDAHKKTLIKDGRNYEPFFILLINLYEKSINESFSFDRAINQIFDPQKKESPVDRFRLLGAMLNLKIFDQYVKERYLPLEEIYKILRERLFLELGIKASPNAFLKRVLNKLRDPVALFVYLGKINTLPKTERENMITSLRSVILSMLNETWEKYRSESPQLKEIIKRNALHKAVIDLWLKETSTPISQVSSASDEKERPQNVEFFEFLKRKLITETHLLNAAEIFPTLFPLLRNDFNLAAINEALTSLRQKIQTARASKNNKALLSLKAEDALLTACVKPKFSIDEALRIVQMTLPVINNKKPQFILDLEDFIKARSKYDELQGCNFSASSNLSDLLCLGRETGGCQNVDGIAELNKYLLGYADGKTAIWSINKEGRLIIRSVAKLLYSEKRKGPVIFLESLYSLNPNPVFMEMFLKQIKLKASQLGLPFLVRSLAEGEKLESFGVSEDIFYEYDDGAENHQNNGKYTITKTVELP